MIYKLKSSKKGNGKAVIGQPDKKFCEACQLFVLDCGSRCQCCNTNLRTATRAPKCRKKLIDNYARY